MFPQTSPPANNNSRQKKSSFSPIILPQSPAAVSTQKNLTGLPRVARDIAADIYNNIQKWNEHHVSGSKAIQQVINLKDSSPDLYTTGLESLMFQLYDILQKLSIYSNALIFLSSQMHALCKMQKYPNPLFVSLTVFQLSELVKAISEAYRTEFQAKQYVVENIAHSRSKQELMFFATSWTHQRNITPNVNLKLETILVETGHRKCS